MEIHYTYPHDDGQPELATPFEGVPTVLSARFVLARTHWRTRPIGEVSLRSLTVFSRCGPLIAVSMRRHWILPVTVPHLADLLNLVGNRP